MQAVEQLIAGHQSITLTDTNKRYHSKGPALPLLLINNAYCEAVVALQGAQLLEFTPHGSKPLLWLSPNANFIPGQAVRGGIPVCLPWFGVNQLDPEKPKHGFVRNRDWQLSRAETTAGGATQLTFLFTYAQLEPELFTFPFSVELVVTLSDAIGLQISTTNSGAAAMPFSWAFHSYHPVSNLSAVRIEGLESKRYLDNTRGLAAAIQDGAISFQGEVDRVYENVASTQVIKSTPAISVTGENCDSAIVWNPGADNAAAMADIGASHHKQFVCLERGAALNNAWTLSPGEVRVSRLTINAISQ
ncbi:D-hexose-6-phosphate mutarotase [Maricurvus nonylphenolicus]|uniref:D-hexose-6-phosphate mutarotase n=1 Tax=Maricurvus nonylphenolicus TaxID=1008307 RepID=UPI0036F2A46A